MKKIAVTLILFLGMVFIVHADPSYVDRELIVKFKSGTSQATLDKINRNLGTTILNRFKNIGAYHLQIQRGDSVPAVVAKFNQHPAVEYAEPNYIVYADVIPNDPGFSQLWGLHNTGQTGGTPDADIDAPEAWDISTGSLGVVVGVIDSGIDYTHPDLAANIWTNPGEIPGNGIDDDGNGYVDDVHGYDFANNDGDPMDDNGHGTHVSGTIGAIGNNSVGVVGVNWHVSLMGLKFLSASGSGSTANAILAIGLADTMGAKLTSNSWGGGGPSSALKNAIAASSLFVAAAGNNGWRLPSFPAAYPLENIISVAATGHTDNLASFSNFGVTLVDLGAPGVDILSTLPGNQYGLLSGTSMATPHVSGVAALIFAVSPNASAVGVKSLILDTGDPVPSLIGKTVTGKRLNAVNALAIAASNAAPLLPVLGRPILASDTTVTHRTRLDAAFPSPANPEVWIPYRLGKPSEVTIHLYDATGRLVRTLELGHQPTGVYDSKSTAAHWDGRNTRGEVVPSGFYFYTLKAGDFTATRKLLIVR